MPITTVAAVPADVDTVVKLYFASFQNPFAVFILPDIPTVRQWFTTMLADELADPSALFFLAFEDPENTTIKESVRDRSTAIAFVKWNRPSHAGIPQSTELPTWPAGANAAVANEFFTKLARAHTAAVGVRPHWYLEMLGTLPAAQGRGAGSALLRQGLNAADEAGEEAYLESSPDALVLYEHFGFVRVGYVEIEWEEKTRSGEMIKYENVIMVRQPKAKN